MSTGLVFRIQKQEQNKEGQPAGQLAPGMGGETQQVVDSTEQQQQSDSGIKEIILKGPLSHAYTEALNLLLNKKDNRTGVIRSENNMTQMVAGGLSEEQEEELSPADSNRSYVYVYDGRRMNLGEIEAMASRVADTKKNNPAAGYVGVVVEGYDEISRGDPSKAEYLGMQMMHLESEYGVKVIYTRNAAVNKMEALLGGF